MSMAESVFQWQLRLSQAGSDEELAYIETEKRMATTYSAAVGLIVFKYCRAYYRSFGVKQ